MECIDQQLKIYYNNQLVATKYEPWLNDQWAAIRTIGWGLQNAYHRNYWDGNDDEWVYSNNLDVTIHRAVVRSMVPLGKKVLCLAQTILSHFYFHLHF